MITHDMLRQWETGDSGPLGLPLGDEASTLARLVRLAIAADEMLHSPHTAQQAALRDALREEGLR